MVRQKQSVAQDGAATTDIPRYKHSYCIIQMVKIYIYWKADTPVQTNAVRNSTQTRTHSSINPIKLNILAILLIVSFTTLVLASPAHTFGSEPTPTTPTSITISAYPTVVNYNTSMNISGLLNGPSAEVANQTVTVSRSYDKQVWLDDAPVTTDSTGKFETLPYVLQRTTYLRFSYSGTEFTGSSTKIIEIKVYAKISDPKFPTAVRKGALTTVTGYLNPKHRAGTKPVRIYRYRKIASGVWQRYDYVNAVVSDYSTYSRYTATLTLPVRGTWRIKAYYPPNTRHAGTWSKSVEVKSVGTRLVALTFDDGPALIGTPAVLKSLSRYNARATFFLQGSPARKRPHIVREIALRGHQLGNHRYTHTIRSTEMSSVDFKNEVVMTNQAIEQALADGEGGPIKHRYPIAFRYPWGVGNARTEAVLDSLNMRSWGWSYGPGDGGNQGSFSSYVTWLIANKVLSNVKPNSIILLHDAPNQPNTVAALPIILKALAQRDYDFVTIEELRRLR